MEELGSVDDCGGCVSLSLYLWREGYRREVGLPKAELFLLENSHIFLLQIRKMEVWGIPPL